jgi:hypothetical protein
MAVTGHFQYAWTNVQNIRSGYLRAQRCNDPGKDLPYSRIRWKK